MKTHLATARMMPMSACGRFLAVMNMTTDVEKVDCTKCKGNWRYKVAINKTEELNSAACEALVIPHE